MSLIAESSLCMPERTNEDNLLPALLDRLRDDEPHKMVESRDKSVISANELHDFVKRDLTLLLNTVRLERSDEPLDAYPDVAKSV